MALMSPAIDEEEDGWFGEGSAFDSGEDLAAALLELAGTPVQAVAAEAEERSGFEERAGSDLMFELLRPQKGGADETVEATAHASKWSSATQSQTQARTWTVRSPGSLDLPARKPGKTGWSIRSSVQLLQRTEEVMLSLREEAVNATLVAAARAVRTAK